MPVRCQLGWSDLVVGHLHEPDQAYPGKGTITVSAVSKPARHQDRTGTVLGSHGPDRSHTMSCYCYCYISVLLVLLSDFELALRSPLYLSVFTSHEH